MVAFALTLALFSYWFLIGWAGLSLLYSRRCTLQTLLLAPTVGIAITLLPIFVLNQLGLSVKTFSLLLGVVLLVASLTVLYWKRPTGSFRAYLPGLWLYLPYLVVLIGSVVLVGRPMFEYGLNWVSYANDDMANYVLLAHRHVDNAYFDIPTTYDLLDGRDYTKGYWIFIVVGERSGAQLLLAWIISITGLTGLEVYMPDLLAQNAALVSAAGALVYQSRKARLAALLTMLTVAMSTLNALGTLFQLAAQVGGVGLLIGLSTILLQPIRTMSKSAAIRRGLLIGLLGAALLVMYPEVVPFLGIGFVLYCGVQLQLRRSAFALRPSITTLGLAGIFAVIIVNLYGLTAVNFLLKQVTTATAGRAGIDIDRSLFPYFLIPSGLAALWGFQPITSLSGEPWLSASIVLGGLLLAAVAVAAVVLTWRGHAVAVMTIVMLLLAVQLGRQGVGFGLFKLAMFSQPFLWGTLVVGWLSLVRRPLVRVVPLAILALLAQPANFEHVQGSRGLASGFFVGASAAGVSDEMRALVQSVPDANERQLVFDTTSVVAAKLMSLYTRGISSNFASAYFFPRYSSDVPTYPLAGRDTLSALPALSDTLTASQVRKAFPWFSEDTISDPTDPRDPRNFVINTVGLAQPPAPSCDYVVKSTSVQAIFNRWNETDPGTRLATIQPCQALHNFLIFVDSELGHSYYLSNIPQVTALNQVESDVIYPRRTFMGIGRRLVLQALNPTPGSRLVVEMTASIKGDNENRLPPAVVIGAEHQSLPIVGRGAARVFSDPVEPLEVNGRTYVGIDMGVDGQSFPSRRTGIMAWWGRDVPLDRRLITGFARDISLISAEDVARLDAPNMVQRFPDDLANQALEFSGMYEDGWVSEAAYFGLARADDSATVVARGEIPDLGNSAFTTELQLSVDGQEVAHRLLRPGRFEVRAVPPSGEGRRRVDLRFSDVQRLGGLDGRPIAARIRTVGFEPETPDTPPEAIKELPADVQRYSLWASGLDPDGWVTDSSLLELLQSAPTSDIVLRGMVPQLNDPGFTTELQVRIDGQEVLKRSLTVGNFRLRAPLPTGTGRRRVELRFSGVQQLPDPDRRRTPARLQYIGIEASSAADPPTVAATPSVAPSEASPLQAIRYPSIDLANPTVSAVGASADGWLARTASFDLAQPQSPTALVVRGMVPLVGNHAFSTELQVLVDGQEIARQTLGLGDFEIRGPASSGPGKRHVELRFAADQQLPAPDGRMVAARVQFVGFEADAPPSPQPR